MLRESLRVLSKIKMKTSKPLLLLGLSFSLNLYAAADLPSPRHFNETEIATIRHFAKHSYIVAQQFYEWERVGDALEAAVDVGGEHVRSFRGRTGFTIVPHEHAIGAIYRRDNTIYISYHGSHFASDWVTDFKASKAVVGLPMNTPAAKRHGFEGNIHFGFSETVLSSYESMLRQIRAIQGATPINDLDFVFTGHSLGGALAVIAARQFSVLNGGTLAAAEGALPIDPLLPADFDRKRIKLVTFSAPPVGDLIFAARYREHVPVALRFHHSTDVVANLEKLLFKYISHVGHPVEMLFLEPTASLVTTAPGLHTLGETFRTVGKQNCVGAAAHTLADGVLLGPRGGCYAAIGYAAKAGAAAVDGVSRVAPPLIKLMHLVPEEDVVLKAFAFEKARAGDDDYKGPSWFDYTRNPIIAWCYKHFI